MALFKPTISSIGYGTGNGLELFVSTDIYRYDVDNRPLVNLADNDTAIKDAVDAIVDEIEDAYDGKFWPDGTTHDWSSLDGRLDNMDIFLQNFFEVRNVQFSSYMQFASFLRERFTSGFMNGPFPDRFLRSGFSTENNDYMPSPFGAFYAPERTSKFIEGEPEIERGHLVAIETRIEQDGTSDYRGKRKPIYALVNGFIVPMLNEHGGIGGDSGTQGEDVDSHRAAEPYGPITIGFEEPSISTGYQFDFSFLEVWLEEVSSTSGILYPNGSRDYSIIVQETIDGPVDGSTAEFSFQPTLYRDLAKKEEVGWGVRVYVRDDTDDIPDADFDTFVCEDDSSGNLTGTNCNGTVNYSTGEIDITFDGGSEPAAGKYIVAYFRASGVNDPSDYRLRGTISFLPNGNYLQVQHRIRVVSDVDYETYPDWFTDETNVSPRAGNAAVVGTYSFRNAINDFNDGNLWVSGSGDSASKTALSTFDGYVYAVALGAWSRFNSGVWDVDNQNGGSTRPDRKAMKWVDPDHWLDLRPTVLNERYDMRAAAENTLDRVIRGAHHTIFDQAYTDYQDNGTWSGEEVWGAEIPELWRIYQYSGLAVADHWNTVRDIGLATTNEAGEAGYSAPTAHHDGIRQLFSPQEEVQDVAFYITDVTNSDDASPSTLISYDRTTKTITVSTDSSSLSGYDSGDSAGLIVNDTYPRMWWRGSRQPVILSTKWQNLGTKTATCVIDDTAATFESAGTIDGYIELLYPESTGIGRPINRVDLVEFTDGVTTYRTRTVGNYDGSPAADQEDAKWHNVNQSEWADGELDVVFNLPAGMALSPDGSSLYVCDPGNNRIIKIEADDYMQYEAQWPTHANYPFDLGSYNSSIHVRYPVAVTTDASGNVYVVDRDSHRLLKLDAGLTTLLATFGTDGTAANDPTDTTKLSSPEGVAIDSSGNVYIADTELYRVVKLNNSLTYVDHIGDGTPGPGEGQFVQPMGLTVGSVGGTEYLYITDQNRLVSVRTDTLAVEAILGSPTQAEMMSFFRQAQGKWTSMVEDADLNKYVVWNDRKQVMKFDKGWQLLYTFGQDNISGYDDEHLYWPLDIQLDPDASLVYVADGDNAQTQVETPSRVVVLNSSDLSYVDEFQPTFSSEEEYGGAVGLHLIKDAGTGAKLYVTSYKEMFKYSLPVPGSRGDTTTWSLDWSTNEYDAGDVMLRCHDITGPQDDSVVYVGDMFRSKVYELNPATGAVTDSVSLGVTWPPASGYGAPAFMELSPDGSELYVCGDNDPKIRVVDTATMTITDNYDDDKNWATGSWPFNVKFNSDNSRVYVLTSDSTLIYEYPFTPTSGSITDNYIKDLASIPFSDELDLAIEWQDARDVEFNGDILYVTDPMTNTVTAVDAASMRVLGQVGSPAVTGKGSALFSGVSGIASKDNWLFLADSFNNRVMKTYKYCPTVERGTGRLVYLLPPPSTITANYMAVYTPYQGQWGSVATPAIYGRNYIFDPNLVYLTTLGRGTPTTISQEGGMGFYANMVSHLPTPADTPEKAPRVLNEYVFAPNPIPITSEIVGTPFVRLPVINRYPATAQEIYPLYGGGSRFDFNRVLFMRGPGPDWPSDTPSSWINRGFDATGTFPGYDILETFPMKTISIPRIIFSTCVAEIDGKGYLVILSTYKAHASNVIGDGPITADIFRLFGNPGMKPRY